MARCRECGQNAGNDRRLCKQCSIEDYHGTPDDQAARRNASPGVNWWVEDINEVWHAAMYSEDGRHVAACGTILDTPVAGITEDPRHRDDPETCDDCEDALEDDDAPETDAEFLSARELATDGGRDQDRAEIDPLQMIVAMIIVAIAFYAFLVVLGVTAL